MIWEKEFIFRVVGLTLIGIAASGSSCGTVQIENFTPPRAEQYTHSVSIDGVVVRIKRITQPEDSERYFGTNLLERNVLPIYVFIDNHNGNSSILIDMNKIFVQSKAVTTAQSASEDVEVEDTGTLITHRVAQRANLILFHWPAPLLPYPAAYVAAPVALIASHMRGVEKDIERILEVKRLRDKMLSPGASTSGFVYFIIPTETTEPSEREFRLQLRDSDQLEKTFVFPLP